MSQNPNPHEPQHTEVHESDPNADSAAGLAGGMGVSSERRGRVRGVEGDVTYGAAPYPTPQEKPRSGLLSGPGSSGVSPVESAEAHTPETNPPSPGKHRFDPESNTRHGV